MPTTSTVVEATASYEWFVQLVEPTADRVVLAFDNYEVFRLADSWLRREFIPALDAGTRVVLVSSEPPAASAFPC